jgi:hypothetical protein
MNVLDFDKFLYDIPWSDNMRHKLRVMADRDDLRYLVAWDNAGQISCSAFTGKPDSWPDTAFAIWSKRGDDPNVPVVSKTMQALALVLDEGMTVYAAAKQVGVHESAKTSALTATKSSEIQVLCQSAHDAASDLPLQAHDHFDQGLFISTNQRTSTGAPAVDAYLTVQYRGPFYRSITTALAYLANIVGQMIQDHIHHPGLVTPLNQSLRDLKHFARVTGITPSPNRQPKRVALSSQPHALMMSMSPRSYDGVSPRFLLVCALVIFSLLVIL